MQLDLDGRIARIEEALANDASPWDDEETERARAEIRAIENRRAIAGGHVVAALVGGTGSGKSSLFNCLTGTELADAGALRPTTEAATAFTWGEPARTLTNYLGIERERVTSHTTELERAHEKALEDLVLLDLPDHDSVKDAHSGLVDSLLPLVDVLVWVVDPQKYADHILHSRYLAKMRRRADAMVIVMNHIDRVPEARREALLADLAGVLELDGLLGVPILATSAETGEGIDELRRLLAKANAEPSMVERTASAELDAVVAKLKEKLSDTDSPVTPQLVNDTASELVTACGVDAVIDALGHAISHPRDASVPPSQSPSYATVAAVGSTWAMRAQSELPQVWADRVDDAMPGVKDLGDDVHTAVRAVDRPPLRDGLTRFLQIAWIALFVVGVGLTIASLANWLAIPLAVGIALLVAGAVAFIAAAVHRSARARKAPKEYYDNVLACVRTVVEDKLVQPTLDVLADHEALRAKLR
ncbi:hypothetical protein BSZ39_03685 [Bowdeniella nasicola]|uniref:G domain-containing protein n=1 Tax=Bowdeniella nasicola TaxID=208480 RepID=A0A1Q5Q3S8_9ACTO|nr:GTPase [Bowdeniella nasicola]OKL54484.1 hypothetical protein BSZ39_03685 [Bowdeniella nasicola]